jgi:hypothetical protein
VRRVELTGLAAVAPQDPEPEYVSVNRRNQAVITLQENNFDSRTGAVVFSSGAELERLAVRYGQYPEFRAEDKGVEPEGLLPLPQRDGLAVASEEDAAADQVRASVTTTG